MGRGGEVTRGSEARGGKAGRGLGREWFRRWCGWLMERGIVRTDERHESLDDVVVVTGMEERE